MILDRDEILAALADAGLDDEALYEDYSGRFMYGDTCLGIVCGAGEFARFCAGLGEDGGDWLDRVRTDNMGLSTIWYWPGVKLVEEAA